MALGNDLDSKITLIYQEYLKKQKDEKVVDRVYASEESFRNGLEEVIKVNGIIDKNEFYTAISFEIQNGNFSISNDGKIDMHAESITKAVERAKEKEKSKSFQETANKNNEGNENKFSQYKDLLEIKEVKTLEEARKIISADVPKEIFDRVPKDIKRQAFEKSLEESVGREYAAPLAEIATEGLEEETTIVTESDYRDYFENPEHMKAFGTFLKSGQIYTCLETLSGEHPQYREINKQSIHKNMDVCVAVFATVVREQGDNQQEYLDRLIDLSKCTEEQMELYSKVRSIYTRDDGVHDGRLSEHLLRVLKSTKTTDIEELKGILIDEVKKFSGEWTLNEGLLQSIQEIVNNTELFKELAEITKKKSEVKQTVNKFGNHVITNGDFAEAFLKTNQMMTDKSYFGITSREGAFLDANGTVISKRGGNELPNFGYTKGQKVPFNFAELIAYKSVDYNPNRVSQDGVQESSGLGVGDFTPEQLVAAAEKFRIENDGHIPGVTDRAEKEQPSEFESVILKPAENLEADFDAALMSITDAGDDMFAAMFGDMAEEMVVGGSEVEKTPEVEPELEPEEEIILDAPPVVNNASGIVAEDMTVGETSQEFESPEESKSEQNAMVVDTTANKIKRSLIEFGKTIGKAVKGVFGKIASAFNGGNNSESNNTGSNGGGVTQEPKDSQIHTDVNFIPQATLNFDFLKAGNEDKKMDPTQARDGKGEDTEIVD